MSYIMPKAFKYVNLLHNVIKYTHKIIIEVEKKTVFFIKEL